MLFNLDVFDNLADFEAVEILLIFLEEISVECERLKDLTFVSGIELVVNELAIANEKKKAIKGKLMEFYNKKLN